MSELTPEINVFMRVGYPYIRDITEDSFTGKWKVVRYNEDRYDLMFEFRVIDKRWELKEPAYFKRTKWFHYFMKLNNCTLVEGERELVEKELIFWAESRHIDIQIEYIYNCCGKEN